MNYFFQKTFLKPGRMVFSCLLALFLFSCGEAYTPKPRGYFRIALPPKAYKLQTVNGAFSAEIPVYSKALYDTTGIPTHINLDFPQFRGCIYLTYKQLKNDLDSNLEYSRSLTLKHIQMASAIDQIVVTHPEHKVYGLIYDIRGAEAASAYQFYVTDSTRHFLRGALYFSTVPNNDSLAPVIQFITKDVEHFLGTLRWK